MLAADLHVHLDGSLRRSTLLELAREQGVCPESGDGESFVSGLPFTRGMTLVSCLARFDVTVGLLQSERVLRRVADELVRDCYLDGVRHVEIRMCPPLHTRAGLSPHEALEAVVEGIDAGASACSPPGSGELMSARVILSVLEGSTGRDADALVDLAMGYAGSGVAGVDLAGDEALFEAAVFERAFSRAGSAGLGVTVHAGEGADPTHVIDAVTRLKADRIGHGVAAARDSEAIGLLAETGTVVECCISSNLHTGAIGALEEHPLPLFLDRGVRAVLATDNRFFSGTTLSREYDLAAEHLGLGRESLSAMAVESARASFLPGEERRRLIDLVSESAGA
ncbi:MAG: adenosine deaminase [Candidatus Eisenbacteria bacterium]|nr:adenosine deaminase [Candidatus Eisenbacteria bacterium]